MVDEKSNRRRTGPRPTIPRGKWQENNLYYVMQQRCMEELFTSLAQAIVGNPVLIDEFEEIDIADKAHLEKVLAELPDKQFRVYEGEEGQTPTKIRIPKRILPTNLILDAGCGDGLLPVTAPSLDEILKEHGLPPILHGSDIRGVDHDYAKILSARENYARENRKPIITLPSFNAYHRELEDLTRLLSDSRKPTIADPEWNSYTDPAEKGYLLQNRTGKFGLVVCNQVLHWVKDKLRVLEQLYEMLAPGGLLAISVASPGSAADILEAYRNELNAAGRYNAENNPRGYQLRDTPEDFVKKGVFKFLDRQELITVVEDAGDRKSRQRFKHVAARGSQEEIFFERRGDYPRAVRHYGWKEFVAPFAHLSETDQNKMWGKVCQRFYKTIHDREGPEGNEPFKYFQFSEYLIARKPPLNLE